MKSPAFQFYPADYLADEQTQVMTLEEEGAYLRALCYCWREGSIPSDPKILARLIGKNCSEETARVVQGCFKGGSTTLGTNGQPAGRLLHARLDNERDKQRLWKEKSSQGGIRSSQIKKETLKKTGSSKSKGGARVVEPPYVPNANSSSMSLSSSISNKGDLPLIPSLVNYAPKISMTEKGHESLIAEFGEASFSHYLPICSDWLQHSGKKSKDSAAFMRNWIRREIAERKGFYYPKQNQIGFKPHTAATTVEHNLEYIRKVESGEIDPEKEFRLAFNCEEKLKTISGGGGGLVPVPIGNPERSRP